MIDTRTRRSRAARARASKFADDATVDRLVQLAAEPEAGVFFLVVAQPMFEHPTSYSSVWEKVKATIDTDRGLEDYPEQFSELWKRLVVARRGRPTIVLAGDIHRSSIGVAASISTMQVVSSPMALVDGVATLGKISKIWSGPEPDPLEPFPLDSLLPATEGRLERLVATDLEGMAFLSLRAAKEAGEYELDVSLVPRSGSRAPLGALFRISTTVPAGDGDGVISVLDSRP